jgi:hypothetical protein
MFMGPDYEVIAKDPPGKDVVMGYLLMCLSTYVIVRIFMGSSFRFFQLYVLRREYKVTVNLGDTVFEDRYLFAPIYGKMILIGEKPALLDCENIIAINRDKITYIKVLVYTVMFDRKRYTTENSTYLSG